MSNNGLNSNIKYYDTHAQEFCESTFSLNMSEHHRAFAERLPKGGRVLDAGCGSGRDALAFSEMGFQVEAFDASREIVRIAREWTGLDIRVCTFEEFCSVARFNGIWASGSLLHLNQEELVPCLERLRDALVAGGFLWASFKIGEGVAVRGERTFLNMNGEFLSEIISVIPQLELLEALETADVRPSRKTDRWINALIAKC